MLRNVGARVVQWVIGSDAPNLRVQIFRLGAFTTTLLSVLVVPLNFVSHMPREVHLATLAMGLSHLGFFLLSRLSGRTHAALFMVVSIAILDWVWFWNGGSQGSITYYFSALLLFSIAVFRGPARAWIAAGQVANAGGLFLLEYLKPGWVTPFASPVDRLLDHGTGIVAAATATAAIAWLIIRSHAEEHRRLEQTAEELAKSEHRYREVFDSTSDAVFLQDASGRVLDLNERARVLFGLENAQPAALRVADWCILEHPYAETDAREKLAATLAGTPQVFEWLCRRGTGELFWAEVALRRGNYVGNSCVIASVRDITNRKRVQLELLANEERLRLAMLASRQGWFEINVQSGRGVSSPEYPRMLGFEPAEFVTSVDGWLDAIHPEDRPTAEQELNACIACGDTRSMEYRRRTKAGGWKWIRSVGRVVERDAQGRPLRLVGMHADITDRKELESQLLHSQRLEAVGTLASGVAHDLNNILTPMLVGAGLLRDKLHDEEDRETVAMMEATGRRGAAIVRQLLAFSRAVTPERRPIAPAELLREVAQLVRSTFPKEIAVVEQIEDCTHRIEGDSTQLHQVLVNLAVNARDAMPHGGKLTLGLDVCEMRPPMAESPNPPPEAFLVLRVADTGGGIPAEIRERIFDPFFTTKEPGKGTGLGLATVHGIVTAHRGFIRFDSTPEMGTEFRVYLPLSSPHDGTAAAPRLTVDLPIGTSPRSHGTILLVDDEPAVLRTTRRMLEREGFEVLATANGAEAIQIMRERSPGIDLVITDFMMPEMDGPTLVPRVREIDPDVKIIGISGLDQRTRAAGLRLTAVLAKPFDGARLCAAVRAALMVRV